MNRRLLGVLSLGHLTVDIVAGGLPALLPYLQREFGLTYLMVGAIMVTSNITSSIVQPIFGAASDRSGARYLLPVGVVCALCGFAALGMLRSFGAILAAVAMAGIGSAAYHPEASRSAYYAAGRRSATGMSVFAVGGNIGTAIGPLLLTMAVAWGGLKATSLFVIPGAIVATIVATTLPVIAGVASAHHRRKPASTASSSQGPLTLLIAVVGLRSAVYGGLLTFVPLYAVNVLHRSPGGNGWLLFLLLGSGALATALTGTIADRYGKKPTVLVSLALAAPLLAIYLLSSGVAALIALALTGASLIGTFALTVVMGQELLPNRLALASGLMIGFTTGLGGLAVVLVGRVADVAGLTMAMWCLVGAACAAFFLALLLPFSGARPAAVEGRVGAAAR